MTRTLTARSRVLTATEAGADAITAHNLLNCLVREVSRPERQAILHADWLHVSLPRSGDRLRVRVRRPSPTGTHRLDGLPQRATQQGWDDLGALELAALVGREMQLRTGAANDEFLEQVQRSHRGIAAALAVPERPAPSGWLERYLASEQALVTGHRFHPAPKARSGVEGDWTAYAPETGARFPLRMLAVRREMLAEGVAYPTLGVSLDLWGEIPDGCAALPCHPWQWRLVRGQKAIAAAIASGDIVDLGPVGPPAVPTSSVRTLAVGNLFVKCSLSVRITNCVRTNALYELAGAVELTRILEPVLADLEGRHKGLRVLREPVYRTVNLTAAAPGPRREAAESLGIILREGLGEHLRPGLTPLLAAAVAAEHPHPHGHVSTLTDGPGAIAWWDAYLNLLVPPVLDAYLSHGVVFEPHLQNVVVCVDAQGMPAQVFLRDLEGTKVLQGSLREAIGALPQETAARLTYDRRRGWDRVAYCLFVNHLTELAAALADLPGCRESDLWDRLRSLLQERCERHGQPQELRAVISGVPLPAKANLLTRWDRVADRHAGYVPLWLPLGEQRAEAVSA